MSGTTPAEGMTWDLGALRDGVRAAFGPDQRRLVSQSIQSVSDRRKFSAYHYQEAMRIIAAKVGGRPGDELLPIMMGADDNDTGSFEDARFTAYANIVACMHSMRSVADNLVHLVYYATGMNRDAATCIKRERDIAWETVRKKLIPAAVKAELDALHEHADFKYLCALDNHCKHRSIVDIGYAISFTEETHGLRIKAFTHDGIDHAPQWVRPFLKSEFQRQEATILRAGNHLNDYVAQTLAKGRGG
ncbi:hypothetical protein [Xanthomonas campestris]|jgi:hypothetical protein|uniref:hypothetical protein n=1 Tax=Xanthomonas campestris TaxID=339 RepID=UPI000E325C66|nr:hypothetical protein [Xanthomonas campestris]MEA9491718.1 hypothetical protein [Xanthomonas campestris]MEA9510318.1 hypothetical protein [Xanthomonas campestris]MEA9577267.1 hypothetical protein [Xanthomonas campestris]MEB2113447.1 hypothetical protein [Xanthomonas campestris pv. campestris]RFF67293.1 hypothetical protein D0A39_22225 [Xanthomonas campestris pv. campestris]